jgi:peptide subunit release factor RF-3
MRIYSNDGKEFKTVDECNVYEAELSSKKQKEEAEKKARIRKLEEERKEKVAVRERFMKSVNDAVELVNQAVEKYEKETGEKLEYVTLNGKLTTQKATERYNRSTVQTPWSPWFWF